MNESQDVKIGDLVLCESFGVTVGTIFRFGGEVVEMMEKCVLVDNGVDHIGVLKSGIKGIYSGKKDGFAKAVNDWILSGPKVYPNGSWHHPRLPAVTGEVLS